MVHVIQERWREENKFRMECWQPNPFRLTSNTFNSNRNVYFALSQLKIRSTNNNNNKNYYFLEIRNFLEITTEIFQHKKHFESRTRAHKNE